MREMRRSRMVEGRSKADLLKFLDNMGRKGMIPANTASARKAAANKVLATLSEEEVQDVTAIDVDETIRRFGNRFRAEYTPESLQSYASRLRSSIDDFKRHCDNPLNFKPGATRRVLRRPSRDGTAASAASELSNQTSAPLRPIAAAQILPIAVRPDLVVQVAGLPHDLTKAEAQRIANIILAHALPDA
jgi:hypothetical protein